MEELQPKKSFVYNKLIPMTHWILEKKNILFYGFFFLVAALFILGRYLPFFQKNEGMVVAETSYRSWLADPNDEKSGLQLQEELHKKGLVKNKYANDIAQRWLCHERLSMAKPLVEESLHKLGDGLGYYASFSQTSWNIAQRKIEKALEEALSLKKKMGEDKDFSKESLLYGHNLMRILFLNKALKNFTEAAAASKELEDYLRKNNTKLLCEKKEELFSKQIRKNKSIGLADFLAEQKNLAEN